MKDNKAVLQELLKQNNGNYDLNEFDRDHKTLLDYAILDRNIEIMKLLISHQAKLGTVLYSVQKEEELVEIFIALYKASYNFDNCDKLGYTAMHYALSLGSDNAVNILLAFNAKISTTTFNGDNAQKLITNNNELGIFAGTA